MTLWEFLALFDPRTISWSAAGWIFALYVALFARLAEQHQKATQALLDDVFQKWDSTIKQWVEDTERWGRIVDGLSAALKREKDGHPDA